MFQIYSFFGFLFSFFKKKKKKPPRFLLPVFSCHVQQLLKNTRGKGGSFVEHKTNEHLRLAVPSVQSKARVGFQKDGGICQVGRSSEQH